MEQLIQAGKLKDYVFRGELLLNGSVDVIKPDGTYAYIVEIDGLGNVSCNCLGFQNRAECKHSEFIEGEIRRVYSMDGAIKVAVTIRSNHHKTQEESNREIIANLLIAPKGSIRNINDAVKSQKKLSKTDRIAINHRLTDIFKRIDGLQYDIRKINILKRARSVNKRYVRRNACAKS